ncbi:MAG: hypothetical protein JEZ14_17225 [Marinilabiliaceae bacterium]|nr:hypothetical protein [Marinilabiliaceae bacterium]
MKKLNLLLAALVLVVSTSLNAQSKVETLTEFLNGIISFENTAQNAGTPISTIKELASAQADKTIDLTKANVKEVLAQAKDYHFVVITVGTHTIVRITDLNDCIQSGSWGTCMPMGEGYIQKSGLTNKNDYINNIIGIPNTQERKVYFFKKK